MTNLDVLSPFMNQLQAMYGSFDPNSVQLRRRPYYSFVAYPAAGKANFQFFSTAIGQSNRQLTNIQRSGHLDNPFIIKALRTRYFITGQNNANWDGTDASTLYGDVVNGLFSAGVLRLVISSKEWFQIPTPFQYAPPAYGTPKVESAGLASAYVSSAPNAYPGGSAAEGAAYLIDPEFLIGSDQSFMVTIEYPSGAVPVIGTGVVTNDTTLYIGVELDGIEIRPKQ